MRKNSLNRRRMLSTGMALASTCVLPGKVGSVITAQHDAVNEGVEIDHIESEELYDDIMREHMIAGHAPFRADFLAWLDDASSRFVRPVTAHPVSPWSIELRSPGLHPALTICLARSNQINVYVMWDDICWDILISLDVYADQVPDGACWRDTLRSPEAQRHQPTINAWFEVVLNWFNQQLAPATHLALYGRSADKQIESWTLAELARDDNQLRLNRPLNGNCLRHLLPLWTNEA